MSLDLWRFAGIEFIFKQKTIGKHSNNALAKELKNNSVAANFATTAIDGKVKL